MIHSFIIVIPHVIVWFLDIVEQTRYNFLDNNEDIYQEQIQEWTDWHMIYVNCRSLWLSLFILRIASFYNIRWIGLKFLFLMEFIGNEMYCYYGERRGNVHLSVLTKDTMSFVGPNSQTLCYETNSVSCLPRIMYQTQYISIFQCNCQFMNEETIIRDCRDTNGRLIITDASYCWYNTLK